MLGFVLGFGSWVLGFGYGFGGMGLGVWVYGFRVDGLRVFGVAFWV